MPVTINGSTGLTGVAAIDNVSSTELGYVDGVTSAIQTQFAGKLSYSDVSSATVTTMEGTTGTTAGNLTTSGPTVTLTTGTKALIILTARMYIQNTTPAYCYVSFTVSGSSSVGASESNALILRSSGDSVPVISSSRVVYLSGLTAGSNTFTMKYWTSAGTANFGDRNIIVVNLGS